MLQNYPLWLPPLHFDADPDPAFHFDADPAYQVDADPTFQLDADPDPSFQLKAQNLEKLLKKDHIPYIWLASGSSLSLWCGSGSYLSI
jgi:hypothetical protein